MLNIASRRVQVTGHRGNSVRAPENTMAAFRAAISGGADAVETDVRLTADAVPILFHDPDLVRIADAPATVADLTVAELQSFDVGAGETIPTLADLAELCRGRAGLILDLKIEGALPAIASVLTAAGFPPAEVTVCAWTEAQAGDVQHHLPASRLVFIDKEPLEHDDDAWFAGLTATGFSGVSLRWDNLTPALIERAHRAGLTVTTWTINDPDDANRALAAGVDNIITDDPTALYAAIDVSEPE